MTAPRTILYVRVSTAEQHVDHQISHGETFARSLGLTVDEVVCDHGASGVGTALGDRPHGKRLFDMLRRGDTLIVRWVDRLGRNYADVTDALRLFMRKGVIVRTVINGLTFDGATTDPMQTAVRDALISFMAATAEAQALATKEAQRAGIEGARERAPEKFLGRKPSYDRDTLARVQELSAEGKGASEIAREVSMKRGAVIRILEDPARAAMALERWA